MRSMKVYRILALPAIVATGLVFFLSNCKKEKEIVTETVYVNVHDTIKGKDITGLCTYPDYTGAMAPAKGAVLSLYAGSSATGTPVATAFPDQSGNYLLRYLIPGNYFLTALYNTENQNKSPINGVNFIFDGIAITMGTSNITQNIVLASVDAPGTLKIAIDTIAAGVAYRKVAMESHSKTPFETQHNGNQQALQGGFNVFKFTSFVFDEANPANIMINAYVQTSTINTFEPARDALAGGCVRKTLNVDTMIVGGVVKALPVTDTIRFYATPGEVVKYGKGYLAHGHMRGFYKHPYGTTGIGGSGPDNFIPADTSYLQDADGIAYGTTIDKPVDMYFEYMSKIKQVSGSNFNWIFTFEGKFTINKRTGWYITGGPISDVITVTPHVAMSGTLNVEY